MVFTFLVFTLLNLIIFGLNLKLYTEFFKERVKKNEGGSQGP